MSSRESNDFNRWSVKYEIDRERSRVIVLFIGHRKDVYDEFSRLL
ncbi:MAG: hypothetical protein WCC94_10980 [Candidatus Bathyarchaeia archaeon]|jgi:hypothetical protein